MPRMNDVHKCNEGNWKNMLGCYTNSVSHNVTNCIQFVFVYFGIISALFYLTIKLNSGDQAEILGFWDKHVMKNCSKLQP